jgi:hypothetical protein
MHYFRAISGPKAGGACAGQQCAQFAAAALSSKHSTLLAPPPLARPIKVRCLLRVSIYHVSFLRGLFPADYFSGAIMNNLGACACLLASRHAHGGSCSCVDQCAGSCLLVAMHPRVGQHVT